MIFQEERAEGFLEDIKKVMNNPTVKASGMYVEIVSDGKIILHAGNSTEMHTHSLDVDDSLRLLNIIRISAKEDLSRINKK